MSKSLHENHPSFLMAGVRYHRISQFNRIKRSQREGLTRAGWVVAQRTMGSTQPCKGTRPVPGEAWSAGQTLPRKAAEATLTARKGA